MEQLAWDPGGGEQTDSAAVSGSAESQDGQTPRGAGHPTAQAPVTEKESVSEDVASGSARVSDKEPSGGMDDGERKEKLTKKPSAEPKYGSSLSLARVQSLVSMSTPRHGNQPGIIGNPPFVEFDLSVDGFGSLFLPSAFPQSIDQSVHTQGPHFHMMAATTGNTTGIGAGGERPFPPNSGLAFSTWMFINRYELRPTAGRHQ